LKRRERARCLASYPANDGCLVHPVSRFESRRARGLPFGRLAPRPALRKRRAEIVLAIRVSWRWTSPSPAVSSPCPVSPSISARAEPPVRDTRSARRACWGGTRAGADPKVGGLRLPAHHSADGERSDARRTILGSPLERLSSNRGRTPPGMLRVRPESWLSIPASKRRPPDPCAFGDARPDGSAALSFDKAFGLPVRARAPCQVCAS
jgi:hypothetical protein